MRAWQPKSFWTRLFTSPYGEGFRNSPFIYFLTGPSLIMLGISGVVTGRLPTKQGGFIYFLETPRFFSVVTLLMLALGLGLSYRGWRLWRAYDDN